MNWIPGDEGRVCATGTSTVTITLERKSVGSPNWVQINSVEDSSSPLSGTDVGLYMYGTNATIDDLIFTNVAPAAPSAGVTVDVPQASAQMSYVVDTPPSASVTSVALTSTAASPQNSGTAITFTANSSGGVAPHQYKFLLSQGGGAAQGVRDWSTSPTYTWTPPTAGTYTMIVWARSAGVTVDAAQASAQMAYVVNTPPPAPVTSVALTSTAASPQNSGTAITFTATSSGGVAPHQYKFFLSQGGGAAQGVREWSTSPTYTWTPPTAGTYTMIVWARSAGVTVEAAQASAQMAYVVNTPPPASVTSVALTSNAASPQNSGTAITFTANSSGGVAPHQFKFLVSQGGGAAQGVRDWSTATTYTWTPPTAGTYTVIVWARSAGVTVDAAQASAQMAYVVNTPPPASVTSVALTSTAASPQNTGTAITFTANSSGGVAPHQFKFLVQPAGGAAQGVRDWSTATTYTWTPPTAGTYTVIVWARSAGVTVDAAQASAQMAYVVNTPPPAPVTSVALTSNLATPQNSGTAITFTADSSGGVAPHQYKFLVQPGGGAAQGVQRLEHRDDLHLDAGDGGHLHRDRVGTQRGCHGGCGAGLGADGVCRQHAAARTGDERDADA